MGKPGSFRHLYRSRRPAGSTWGKRIRLVERMAFEQSPCGRTPSTPTGLNGAFQRYGARKRRIKMRLWWTPVLTDVTGVPIRVDQYVVVVQYSPNGLDWYDDDRTPVAPKEKDEGVDECSDPGTAPPSEDNPYVTYKDVSSNLAYRYRVKAVDGGCESPCSGWYVVGNPGAIDPPGPTNVKIIDNDAHLRVTMRWDVPTDVDPELFDPEIDHFIAVISTSSSFGTNYLINRQVSGQHVSFRIDEPDAGQTFYGRVRAVSADDDKGEWIPATIAGNSDPNAPPEGVKVGRVLKHTNKPDEPTGVTLLWDDTEKARHEKWRLKIRWNEVTQDELGGNVNISRYVVQLQKSNNGSTWTEDPRPFVVEAKDEDAGTTAHVIVHAIRPHRFYRARVRAVSESNNRGDFSAWTSGQRPSQSIPPVPTNVSIKHKTKGKDQVVVDWDPPLDSEDSDLVDEDVHHFQVMIHTSTTQPSFGTAFRSDKFVHKTERRFFVPAANQNSRFSAWVRSVGSNRNKSAWVMATAHAGPFGNAVETGDGVPVGTIRTTKKMTVPQGWLPLSGPSYVSTASTTAWPDLFAIYGYSFGGSGSSFGLPDYRRRKQIGTGSGGIYANEGDSDGIMSEDARFDLPDGHRGIGQASSQHTHNAGTLQNSGPGTTQDVSTGGALAAGRAHGHTISGAVNADGSGHSHGKTGGQDLDSAASVGLEDGNRGHGKRGFMRVRWIVKAEN